MQPRDGRRALIAVNDHDEVWRAELHVERQTFAGAVPDVATFELAVPARSVSLVDLPESLVTPADASAELLVATAGETRGIHPSPRTWSWRMSPPR